jgi:hypothetical protein
MSPSHSWETLSSQQSSQNYHRVLEQLTTSHQPVSAATAAIPSYRTVLTSYSAIFVPEFLSHAVLSPAGVFTRVVTCQMSICQANRKENKVGRSSCSERLCSQALTLRMPGKSSKFSNASQGKWKLHEQLSLLIQCMQVDKVNCLCKEQFVRMQFFLNFYKGTV